MMVKSISFVGRRLGHIVLSLENDVLNLYRNHVHDPHPDLSALKADLDHEIHAQSSSPSPLETHINALTQMQDIVARAVNDSAKDPEKDPNAGQQPKLVADVQYPNLETQSGDPNETNDAQSGKEIPKREEDPTKDPDEATLDRFRKFREFVNSQKQGTPQGAEPHAQGIPEPEETHEPIKEAPLNEAPPNEDPFNKPSNLLEKK